MAYSLITNANDKYYENLSILVGKPNQVKVIVEDELDVSFWYDILNFVTSNKIYDIKKKGEHHESRIRKIIKML